MTIDLAPYQWLTLTAADLPMHPPAHWLAVLDLLRQMEGEGGLKAMHNRKRIILSSRQALELNGIPNHLIVPRCPICDSVMGLKYSRYGSFFGCEKYPACQGKASCHDYIRTVPNFQS